MRKIILMAMGIITITPMAWGDYPNALSCAAYQFAWDYFSRTHTETKQYVSQGKAIPADTLMRAMEDFVAVRWDVDDFTSREILYLEQKLAYKSSFFTSWGQEIGTRRDPMESRLAETFCKCSEITGLGGSVNVGDATATGVLLECARCDAGTYYVEESYRYPDTCDACPNGGTSKVGATDINDCYLPSGTTGSDTTGTYTYTANCYY